MKSKELLDLPGLTGWSTGEGTISAMNNKFFLLTEAKMALRQSSTRIHQEPTMKL